MQKKGLLWFAPVALIAIVVACSGGSDKQPVSPSSTVSALGTGATTDPVTLKVNAPVLVSPVGGIQLTEANATVTFQAATGKFVNGQVYTYRVQLFNNAETTMLDEKLGTALSYKFPTSFDPDTLYKWRVRAEYQGATGPWTTMATFRSMLKPRGYIKDGELYDPLDDGKTVGTIFGPTTWIPGVGLRLDAEETYVEYDLGATVSSGEFSLLASGLSVISGTEDPKLRVMSMREGGAAINDNIYRMTVDKRGNGATAWRFLSGSNAAGTYIETTSRERVPFPFHEALTYFYKATWGDYSFHVLVQEGGIGGDTVYDGGKDYDGVYQPQPHLAYLGSPYAPGDRGDPSSVDGMIVRQVWLSRNPRPSWAK
jgi:hypothetical protein